MNKVTKVTMVIPTRSPPVHCENNQDGRGTGDRPDSLIRTIQSVAARRISRTFGQPVQIGGTSNGGQFGQSDCTYQINPDPRGTAIPSNSGNRTADIMRDQERKKPYAASGS